MSTMVKCTICGAVFDADLAICPVCGKGTEFFVPVQPDSEGFTRDTDETFVILGGGVAGLSAAQAIRERNSTCTIKLITDEAELPYNRPMLTKAFNPDADGLFIHPDEWYAEHRIDACTGSHVRALDAKSKKITLANGTRIAYDKCIYALGAECFVPPFDGNDLPEVAVIRSTEDVRHIHALLSAGKKKAVIVGGGVLGLEAAWALKKMGADVIVIEQSPRIMSRQLDSEASEMLSAIAERENITLLTSASTEAIEKNGDTDCVSHVRLMGSIRIRADFVVLSVGVRARTGVARKAGAEVGRGVKVTTRMETSLPDVYACGDCAETDKPTAQLWPVAAEMGRVAGANAAGDSIEYSPVSFAVTFSGMNTELYAEGDVGFDEDNSYRTEVTRDDNTWTLEKRYYLGDKLCGVILLGDISKAKHYSQILQA